MLTSREETAKADKWNVEALYPTLQEWEKDYNNVVKGFEDKPIWTELQQYQGRLGSDSATLKKALDLLMKQARLISKVYTYAHLRHDEDIAHDAHKVAYNKAITAIYSFQEAISWFEPELLALPENTLKQLIDDPAVADYKFHLEKIVRMKPHTLPPEQEQLMALGSRSLQTAHKTFSALNDADLDYGNVKDSEGKEHALTHASLGMLGRSKDRTLRKNAFLTFHKKYQDHENTMAELLSGQVQAHIFTARAREFDSCLEAALFPKNIDLDVYHTLIDTVKNNLAPLHRYHELRQEILGLDSIHIYDMTVPLTPDFDITMSYEEAEKIVIESVAPLGTEYQNLLHQGLKEDRWVDRYENANKRSGGYSSGCYDSIPYILLNFKGILRDVFTLAHEAGHSMHSLLSHKHQPYQYADYPIFLAEVASTFNEELLTLHMVKTAESTDEKIFLLNQKIEDIRATFFRQTMFAEFELLIHETAEKGEALTPLFLNNAYGDLVRRFMGPKVTVDAEAESEWARIPHFYYNFYVYQYATGMSAALALAEKVLEGGASEREAYLNFLGSGCSDYPIELLKKAGVDMRQPDAIKATIRTFERMVGELEELLKERRVVST